MPGVQNCTKRRCRRRKKYLEKIHILRILSAYEVANAREQLQILDLYDKKVRKLSSDLCFGALQA